MTMPMATPMRSSCTAVRTPAPENIDRELGTGASGASNTVNASVRTILT